MPFKTLVIIVCDSFCRKPISIVYILYCYNQTNTKPVSIGLWRPPTKGFARNVEFFFPVSSGERTYTFRAVLNALSTLGNVISRSFKLCRLLENGPMFCVFLSALPRLSTLVRDTV